MPIKLFWWGGDTGGINFGDSISPLIVRHLSGKEVVHRTVPHCDVVAVGSLIDTVVRKQWRRDIAFRLSRIKVWGSGSFKPHRVRKHRRLDVFAVRGPLTRDAMNLDPDLPLGDPGLLIDRLQPLVAKRYRWGIIPHVVDADASIISEVSNGTENSIVINLRNPDLLETIRQIMSCDFIVSSSLHGVIAADALGIPHLWTKVGDKVFGVDWKFRDYFLSMEREAPAPISLGGDLRKLEDQAVRSERSVVEKRQNALESSFKLMNL
ncbi:polysaccharide pyruvyl transferase family protein [Aminobacter sp. Piv2-1]|uniref:polysaccharide pyruvyl transferase family protein n=1 Tax=Aminobacter sp. Piv2-1 TaxID=3031122 RepID=UPI00309C6D6F